ncbi:MAG: LLM class flavin-dependent oxidoreductase [Pseudomonadota bacterium]
MPPTPTALLGLRITTLDGVGDPAWLDGFDFVQLGDEGGDNRVGEDPLSIAGWLVARTRTVGVVPVVSSDWAPFHVARALASLDLLSAGRAGWRSLPTTNPARDAEHLDVVLKLFDSWDHDALVFDKARSVFADRDKVRRIRHEGAYYTVDGPLNAPRPPQGWPVKLGDAASTDPRDDLLVGALAVVAALESRAGIRRLAEWPVDLTAEPDGVASAIGAAISAGQCDGVMLRPAGGAEVAAIRDELLPLLRPDGGARPGADLRARLGVGRPVAISGAAA